MSRSLSVLIAILLQFGIAHASDCMVHDRDLCPKLERAQIVKLKPGVPQFIYAHNLRFYVEMRDGKVGNDCDGETRIAKGEMPRVILSDQLGPWDLRESLHHEVSHIAAYVKADGKCRFRDEDEAIEHLSPGWTDILGDPRNTQLVRFLTTPQSMSTESHTDHPGSPEECDEMMKLRFDSDGNLRTLPEKFEHIFCRMNN